jgi:type VI secretion system protein ImpL
MMYYLRLIFSKLFNRTTLTILLLLILSAVVWFIGPIIAIGELRPFAPEWVRWSIIGVIWLLWFIKLLIRWWRERNVNAALLGQLAKMQSSARPNDGQAAGAEEVAELNKRFKDAAEILKKTRFTSTEKGGFLSGLSKQYVYQLPWYAFIGAPGSGKTTALINAGLTFPLAEQFGKAAIRGVGGTRNCDWWFTNEAVLIDTAGRYTTQESNESIDKAEWQGFMGLLKKFRPRQPLNGVLLTVSVADLLQMTAQEREVHASVLKARLNEMREGLGVQFPVYVLVTKADLLAGFSEYFLNYTREDRGQVWGFTLPYDPAATEVIAVRESFAREFDLLYKRLNDGMQQRLLDEPDLSRRALSYTLPQQFAGIREVLSRLLGAVFSESKFAEQPMLRGVYFTSGTQEGTPFDRVLGAMQRTFRVPSNVRAAEVAGGTGKSYFLQDLLQKVIFREHFIAGRNIAAERKLKWLRWGGIAACAITFVWANVAWWLSYRNNVSYIGEVATKTETLQTNVSAIDPKPSENAPALAETLNQSRDLPNSTHFVFPDAPWGYRYGLFQGPKIDSAAQSTYARILEDSLMPRVAARVTARLRTAANSKPEDTYEALKAYLMMYDSGRVKDGFVKLYVGADWMNSLPPDVPTEERKKLLGHLDELLRIRGYKSPFPQDTALVQQVRGQLLQMEPAKRNYNYIKSRLMGLDLPEFTLAQAAGDRAGSVFERKSGKSLNSAGVPGFFSERGYNEHFVKELAKLGPELAVEEAWILGRANAAVSGTKLATGANELKAADRRIRELYLQDFANEWTNFLLDVRLRPQRNMADTIETATTLSAADSPLVLLVRQVAQQTILVNTETGPGNRVNQIKDSVKRGLDEVAAATAALANAPVTADQPEMIVQNRFAAFKTLAQPIGKGKIDDLSKDIQAYALNLRNEQAALSGGGTRRSQDSENSLRSQVASMPPPVRDIVEALIGSASQQSASAVRANASANVAGSTQLCAKAIGGRYPFARSSQQDVLPNDFAQLFASGGEMDTAFQSIAAFVDTSKNPWAPRPGPDGAAAGNSANLPQFQRAREIRDAFFAGGSKALGFEVEARVVTSGNEKIELDVDGQQVVSGDVGKRVSWPGPKKTNMVRLAVLGANGSRSAGVTTDGNWALNRLVDRGNPQPGNSPERVVVNINVEGRDVTLEFRAMSVRNPLNLPALRGFSCPGRA